MIFVNDCIVIVIIILRIFFLELLGCVNYVVGIIGYMGKVGLGFKIYKYRE